MAITMNESIVKCFVELCKNRSIRYAMFRKSDEPSTMYLMAIDDLVESISEADNESTTVCNPWMSTLFFTSIKDKVDFKGTNNFVQYMMTAINIYDSLRIASKMKEEYNFIYIPNRADFVMDAGSSNFDIPVSYFKPSLEVFDGISIKFSSPNPALLLFYREIGRFGIGYIFDDVKEYLKWKISMTDSYKANEEKQVSSTGFVEYTHYIPYIFTEKEVAEMHIDIETDNA